MNTFRVWTRLSLLLVLALVVTAASGGAGAGIRSSASASASPSPYLVTRSGTTYRAVSQATGTTYTGTLKSVVESAVQNLEGSGGGTVSFAAGDFDLGSQFFLLHQIRSITFAGAGMDATVIHNSTDVAADTEPFNFQDTNNDVIRDLTVNAGGAPRSTSDALDFDEGNNSTVERVKITGSRAKGIIFDGKNAGWTSAGNTVRDCVIQNVNSNGIEFLASSNNLVEGCTISNTGRTGIEIGKASPTADQPNKKPTGNIIRNNRIDNGGLNGIYIKSGDRNQILGNTITNSSDDASGNDGIRISSADSISCDGNVVDGNTVTDNQAVKTQDYGLRIGSSLCHDTTVGTNNFAGNRLGPILDSGTNTHYSSSPADTTPPVTSISCNNGSCSTTFTAPVSVTLSASDNTGGSGVAATYYTTNGTDPVTSGSKYTAPFALSATTTVRYASLDNSGNKETPKSQTVTISSGGGGGTSSVTVSPVADSYVSAGATATNYGTLTALRVDGSPLIRSFLRFTISGLSGTVSSASLRIYANTAQSPGFDVYAVASNSWTETGITYANAPTLGAKLGSSGTVTAGSWKTINVTAFVTGNSTYTFALTTSGSTALSLASREAANKPQLVVQTSGPTTDSTPPVTSIACNGGSCGSSFTGPVSVTLSATDNSGGSGVAGSYYTTDGSDPALNGITYTAPFTLNASATVKFYSTDKTGNKETPKSETITITTAPPADTTPPVTLIACNSGSCGVAFAAPVTVSLAATDAGSGVEGTYYTTDGTDPVSSPSRVDYTGSSFTLAVSATVKFYSTDNAGNVEAVKSQTITIGGGGGSSATFTPVADSYVSAGATATNYGTLTALRVDGSPLIRSFLRFTVSGLSGTVSSASLRIYANTAQSPGFDVYAVASNSWTETGITYANAPTLGAKLGSSGTVTAGSWKTINVTAFVTGNSTYTFALTTSGSTALSLASREAANKPQLVVETSGVPTSVTLPVRAAFYYPWFPETWQVNGVPVAYHPTLGYYDSSTKSVVDSHIGALDYGKIQVAIASWWGQGTHSETTRIPLLLNETQVLGSPLKWALYYEQEGQATNPTVAQLQSDLAYIRTHYATNSSYAYVAGKPVIFVYSANDTTCEVADRWAQATGGQWYVSLKLFLGNTSCPNQPDSWHQYGPAIGEDVQPGYSIEISPGFWRADEAAPRLARDPTRWSQDVRDMIASKQPWQLVTTFDEWGEGTSVESAAEWASASGFGSYLDALHNDGN